MQTYTCNFHFDANFLTKKLAKKVIFKPCAICELISLDLSYCVDWKLDKTYIGLDSISSIY